MLRIGPANQLGRQLNCPLGGRNYSGLGISDSAREMDGAIHNFHRLAEAKQGSLMKRRRRGYWQQDGRQKKTPDIPQPANPRASRSYQYQFHRPIRILRGTRLVFRSV
jgi:hypothetical protein